MNSIQGGIFQQDNVRSRTIVVSQRTLQSVDMLPWSARSPDLSVIEDVRDIIGPQLQHHPQPALAVPVLIQQVQQAWDSIPQSDIWHLSSSCASASSSNARELDEQILEVKINSQKNTVSDTSTNKDTLSKEKESENENEETKLIRKDFAHYVGTAIDADIREQILKLGPYQPEGNFLKDAKGRSFSTSYSFISKAVQKIERKWLCYSTRLHVAYCQVCWLFADRTNMYFKEACCKGVNDWQGI
ncbi:uncharacterized protein TNCV_3677231 [Trichonephila clavipes]|nr:uncharacterized protein TNCV_3677231 [Trichonephila clavipes]